MEGARIILAGGEERSITANVTSFGRVPDNEISFPEDSNVSRFHAEIEKRGDDEFWLLDLGSSNGTLLNGAPVTSETPLSDGDLISLGGSSTFTFRTSADEEEEEEKEEQEENTESDDSKPEDESGESPEIAATAQTGGKRSLVILSLAGLVLGLALIMLIGSLFYFFLREPEKASCEAKATFVSPENGDILAETTTVEVRIDNSECVDSAVFSLGGKEIGRTSGGEFKISLDPAKFPELSDGYDRKLSVTLFDTAGKEIVQNALIAVALETIETDTPEDPTGPDVVPTAETVPNMKNPGRPSLIETQQLMTKAAAAIPGTAGHHISNQRFLDEVAKAAPEFASPGYFERAAKFKDVINYQFLREQNLDPSIGYVLAMSRTKFQPTNKAEGAGLWDMNNQIVLDNAYNGICGAETIASETQRCASIAASSYLKDIVLNVFNGDVIYGIAAFGMDKQQATRWNDSLPQDPKVRANFWEVIKDPQRKAQVVRFFAAAMVIENPQKFGLENDRPISELYPAATQ
ncbi:MAG: FHA domain-containing protein [Pyrinomonadaceae bacterium]